MSWAIRPVNGGWRRGGDFNKKEKGAFCSDGKISSTTTTAISGNHLAGKKRKKNATKLV